MTRTKILSLVLLSAATSVFAQQSIKPESEKNTTLTRPLAAGGDCPLEMQASRMAGFPISVPASNSMPATNLDLRISLLIINLRSQEIVGAQITAQGFSDKWKAIDLNDRSQIPDLTKTLNVVLDVKGMGRGSSHLLLNRFTALAAIELNSITYGDGTSWRASSPGVCSITPDLISLAADVR